nr:hypothetical protein [Tanacetum cinerariifolium]
MMVQDQEEMGEGTNIPTDPQHPLTIIQPYKSQTSKKQKPRKTKRKYTQVPQLSVPIESVTDEAVNEKMDDRLMRAATTAFSLEAEQNSGAKTPWGMLLLKLESFDDEGLGEEDASKQERIIDDLDADEDITLVNDQKMFITDKDLQGEEVVVKQEVVANKKPIVDAAQVSVAATTVTIDDITLAKAFEALKSLKPKIRGIFIKDHEEPSKSRTYEIEKERLNLVKMDADYQLAERLQAEEQQELNEEENAKLFMELLEKVLCC